VWNYQQGLFVIDREPRRKPTMTSQEQAARRYMDVGEVAGYLGLSRWMIYKYVESRSMPFIPFGRLIRFDRVVVERWAEKLTVKAAASARVKMKESFDPDKIVWVPPCVCDCQPDLDDGLVEEVPYGNL
jgi:excisionase family DNA binding protein